MPRRADAGAFASVCPVRAFRWARYGAKPDRRLRRPTGETGDIPVASPKGSTSMLTKTLAAAAILALAATASAHADVVTNGIDVNGTKLNDIRLNGTRLNGTQYNGIDLNGTGNNGVRVNGSSGNGIRVNRTHPNGMNAHERAGSGGRVIAIEF